MGWCSGSDVYTPMEKAILNSGASDGTKVELLVALIDTLQLQDWDCEFDVFNPDEPLVVEAFDLLGLFEEEWE